MFFNTFLPRLWYVFQIPPYAFYLVTIYNFNPPFMVKTPSFSLESSLYLVWAIYFGLGRTALRL